MKVILLANRKTADGKTAALIPVKGKPVLAHVLKQLSFVPAEDIVIVTPPDGAPVRDATENAYRYVENTSGTEGSAAAVACAKSVLGDVQGTVLVCEGNHPLLLKETYQSVASRREATRAASTLLVGKQTPPPPYGRLIWNEKGVLVDIVDEVDCTEAQRAIEEVFGGVIAYDGERLWDLMDKICADTSRTQSVTGSVRLLMQEQVRQVLIPLTDARQLLSVSTDADAREAEEWMP